MISLVCLWPAFIKELLALLRKETQGALEAGGGWELSAKGPASAWSVLGASTQPHLQGTEDIGMDSQSTVLGLGGWGVGEPSGVCQG